MQGAKVRLTNTNNWETYSVLVLPCGSVISWSNLQKVQTFYHNGGQVIGTTQLPYKSSEFGHDADVQRVIKSMFGATPARPVVRDSDASYRIRIEASGSTIKTFVKGVLVDVTVDDSMKKGCIGFRQGGDEPGGVDDVKVSSLGGQVLFWDDFDSGLDQWANTHNASVGNGLLKIQGNEFMRSREGDGGDRLFC